MLIQTYILHGKPVASANNHRATGKGGSLWLRSSPEFARWKASVVEQLDEQIKNAGHDVGIVYDVKVKTSKSGKKTRKSVRKNTSPVFTKDLFPQGYYITLWLYAPKYVYRREGRAIVLTKKGEPAKIPFRGDLDGIIKGVYDVLQIAGAIDNDVYVQPGPVYPKTLPDDQEPFVCVLIEPAQEAPDCPFLPIDSSLYMPKVHSSLEWADINRQEEAFRRYRELHGIAEVPLVPKCRCQLCKIFIGQGYMESEIYAHWGRPEWDEPRWTNEVVMICGGCARKRLSRDKDILSKLDTLTEAWLEKHGPSDKQSVFLETRTLLLRTHEAQLMERYATKYRLVNSQEIGKISWLEIEKRRKAFQEKHNVRPEDPHSPTIRHAAKPGAAVLRRPGGANGVADFPGAGDIDTTEAVW